MGRKGGPAIVETLYYKVHFSKCKYSNCRKVDISRAERGGGDMSLHVTAKFDADADADFADEYNLRQN